MNQPVTAPESKYTNAFYAQHLSGSASSARSILGQLVGYLSPSSILDVGCGQGTWLRAAHELGIRDLHGFDGTYVDTRALLIDPSHFTATDLRGEFSTSRRFDLTVSVEVAEHLPITRAESFVRDLCRTSDVVLFSAATPYQGGEDHLNEQWPEYWGILFRRHGYRCFDLFRSEFWAGPEVESWYAQNAFLFVKSDNPLCERLAEFSADGRVLSKIHPEIFLINVTRYRPDAIAQLDAELEAWRAVVSAFHAGGTSLPKMFEASSENNCFTQGRLNYRDAGAVYVEVVATTEAYKHKIRELGEARERETRVLREAAKHELRRLRDERNGTLNALIETSVRICESRDQEQKRTIDALAAAENNIVELSRALDAVKHENALLKQAGSLPHVAARILPSHVKAFIRLIRDELDVRYLRATSYFD